MAYDIILAERVRDYLALRPELFVEEKKMFGGLAFLVNGKMCVNVSRKGLMCRYDPLRRMEVEHIAGYQPMQMGSKHMQGFCYVTEEGYSSKRDFDFWLRLCLDYNPMALVSKK
ncbi:MAG: TfoX/Sxy family protein [Bacteroidetes bacterium]|nr:TfoX/Sxy family protein [Bacteroidota bacterium]MBS1628757.1 TfoX/Sxy family protein [Bacteroidota bacterium]